MKLPSRVPSVKFVPFAIIAFFAFSNTGLLLSHVLAPSASAYTRDATHIPSDIPTSGDKELDWIIFNAGEQEGVDPRFIHAVIWQESRYDNDARSRAGAQGLMQLMPETAKRFGCSHPDDPVENVEAGTKYLSWLLRHFDGNVKLALAGYNAGEGAVDKFNGIPPYSETQDYVRNIAARYGKTFHPILSPGEAILAFHLRD